MTTTRYRSFRVFVLRWHRRIGVALCFAIIWISTSGIFLNHMHDWKLADKLVQNTWVRQQYAVTKPLYYPLDTNTALVQTAGGELLLNQQPLLACDSPVQGAVVNGPMLAIACQDRLILATTGGDVLEVIGAGHGLPTPLKGLALEQQQLMLLADKWYVFSDADLSFTAATVGATSVRSSAVPKALQSQLGERLQAQPISWERLLIDLHTGAVWGENKTLISDVIAILLMLIAIGGVWVWLTKPRRFRVKK